MLVFSVNLRGCIKAHRRPLNPPGHPNELRRFTAARKGICLVDLMANDSKIRPAIIQAVSVDVVHNFPRLCPRYQTMQVMPATADIEHVFVL